MMTIRPFLALALLASVLCGGPASAKDKLTLVLDWSINPDHAPVLVAQERGFFAEWPPAATIWRSPTSRNCTCRSMRACR
jgi:ABC-type nitrate/sulfonate/bicarbonate transport system substrate-binding protein